LHSIGRCTVDISNDFGASAVQEDSDLAIQRVEVVRDGVTGGAAVTDVCGELPHPPAPGRELGWGDEPLVVGAGVGFRLGSDLRDARSRLAGGWGPDVEGNPVDRAGVDRAVDLILTPLRSGVGPFFYRNNRLLQFCERGGVQGPRGGDASAVPDEDAEST